MGNLSLLSRRGFAQGREGCKVCQASRSYNVSCPDAASVSFASRHTQATYWFARALSSLVSSSTCPTVASDYIFPPKRPPPSRKSATRSCTLLKCLPSSLCLSSVVLVFWLTVSPLSPPPTVSLRLSNAATSSLPRPPSTAVFVAEVETGVRGDGVSGMR